MKNKLLSLGIYLVTSGIGIFTFLYPFLVPGLQQNIPLGQVRSSESPLSFSAILFLCLVVLLFEFQEQTLNTKLIALLGVLIAINASLRFIEVLIPGPGGFSPVFFLMILVGYEFGGRIGFFMGALTLLVSALFTGGVGPWLPSQMFTAGWVGMTSGLAGRCVRNQDSPSPGMEMFILILCGAIWGLLYGAIMNLWSWPFIAGSPDQYWSPGISALDTLQRYGVYYLVTSLAWDAARAGGNVILLLSLGLPALKALRRFRRRFVFSYQPASIDSGDYERI